jgi:hypothetical protein
VFFSKNKKAVTEVNTPGTTFFIDGVSKATSSK